MVLLVWVAKSWDMTEDVAQEMKKRLNGLHWAALHYSISYATSYVLTR